MELLTQPSIQNPLSFNEQYGDLGFTLTELEAAMELLQLRHHYSASSSSSASEVIKMTPPQQKSFISSSTPSSLRSTSMEMLIRAAEKPPLEGDDKETITTSGRRKQRCRLLSDVYGTTEVMGSSRMKKRKAGDGISDRRPFDQSS